MVVPSLSVDDLKKKLDSKTKIKILDVRNPDELQYGMILNYTQIPLPELEKRYKELDKKERYVVYCRTGGRSGQACEFLIQKGYKASNLAGGILAWKKYDSSIQEY
ncbi:MAG: rhodanese-like domain-containing protein [Nanoarchaeota archaeon]